MGGKDNNSGEEEEVIEEELYVENVALLSQLSSMESC
jgi:hypothetical protein